MAKEDQVEITIHVGDRKVIAFVGKDADNETMSKAIVEAINNDVDCLCTVFLDESGSITQVPVETMVLHAEPREDLEMFRIRHGLTEKKGRRRGQRKNNFPMR